MVKHGQVAGMGVFDILYGRKFEPHEYTASMKNIILELMAYDNQRERDHDRDQTQNQNIKGTPMSIAMFYAQHPDMAWRRVTLLTKKEYEKLCHPQV